MQTLVLTSATAPHHVGDILALAGALTTAGGSVRVLLPHTDDLPAAPTGVEVTPIGEAPPVIPHDDEHALEWALALDTRLYAVAVRLLRERPADVLVADGWATAYAACNLRASHALPLVARLRTSAVAGATAADQRSRLAAQIEWWLTYEARRVVVPDRVTRDAVVRGFRLPADEVATVPGGTDTERTFEPADPTRGLVAIAATGRAAGPLGRRLRRVGATPRTLGLRASAPDAAAAAAVVVLDPDRADLALAAMAAGRPLVVPDRGPLRELVHARRTGLRAADDSGVVDAVATLLADRAAATRMGLAGRRRATERFAWPVVARRWQEVLAEAIAAEAALPDVGAEHPPLRPVLLRSPLADRPSRT